MNLFDKDFTNPDITAFAKCPTCGELFQPGWENVIDENNSITKESLAGKYQKCPHCKVEIEFEREILPSAINQYFLTTAVSTANSILTFDVAVFLFIGVLAIRAFGAAPGISSWFTNLFWIGPVIAIVFWFHRYGRLNSDDAEYSALKKRLKLSFGMWIGVYVLSWLLLFFLN